MKIVTFNIRYDRADDKENNFCFRKPLILEKLAREAPDLICFQEVLPHVAAWLKEALADYYVIGCPRGEKLDDEQAAIAYRKDRLNLIQMETYWLSETPCVPGSRYPDQSICPRLCTEALFQELATGQLLRVANTHLDHESPGAREKGLRQILEKLDRAALFPEAPVIITGDMNAEPSAPEMAAVKEYSFTNAAENIGITYHGFMRTDSPCCIDYILVKGFVCEKLEKWTDVKSGVFLSDHYPVCAVLRGEKQEGTLVP